MCRRLLRNSGILVVVLAFLASASATHAHAASLIGTNNALTFSGYAEQDIRLATPEHGPGSIERSRTIGSARVEWKPLPFLRGVFDGRFLWTEEARDQIPRQPLRNDVDALFAELDHPGGAPIRVRAGRQTIRWGSALLFNPTSIVNPPDLEDPLRYGAPLGNEMIRFEVLGDMHLDAVVVPRFRPALLPTLDPRAALAASGVPAAVSIANDPSWQIDVTPVLDRPADPSGAVRISGKLPSADVDVALVGYSGRLTVPQLRDANLSADFSAKTLRGVVLAGYPRMQMFGIDLTSQIPLGKLGDAGAWLEASWVKPEAYYRFVTANGITSRTRELDDAWERVAAGLDHTTAGGLYLNLQFVRGFPEEIGKSAQGDYLVLVCDRPFLRERLHARIVGSFDIDDRSALGAPELSWSADSVTFALGAYRGVGAKDSKFGGALAGPPVVYARARASF